MVKYFRPKGSFCRSCAVAVVKLVKCCAIINFLIRCCVYFIIVDERDIKFRGEKVKKERN